MAVDATACGSYLEGLLLLWTRASCDLFLDILFVFVALLTYPTLRLAASAIPSCILSFRSWLREVSAVTADPLAYLDLTAQHLWRSIFILPALSLVGCFTASILGSSSLASSATDDWNLMNTCLQNFFGFMTFCTPSFAGTVYWKWFGPFTKFGEERRMEQEEADKVRERERFREAEIKLGEEMKMRDELQKELDKGYGGMKDEEDEEQERERLRRVMIKSRRDMKMWEEARRNLNREIEENENKERNQVQTMTCLGEAAKSKLEMRDQKGVSESKSTRDAGTDTSDAEVIKTPSDNDFDFGFAVVSR